MSQKKKLSAEKPLIHPEANVVDSTLGSWTEVGARTSVVETIMGDYSYVVSDSQIIYTTIGKFANIASHTRINPGNHPTWRASLHHFMYRADMYDLGEDEGDFFNWRRESHVTIGHDSWIGHGAVILAGVQIGTGAVIGAGAVVSKDVAPYTIVGGVPSKPIKRRVSEAAEEKLMKLAWWDWDHATLKARLADFRSLPAEEFADKYLELTG